MNECINIAKRCLEDVASHSSHHVDGHSEELAVSVSCRVSRVRRVGGDGGTVGVGAVGWVGHGGRVGEWFVRVGQGGWGQDRTGLGRGLWRGRGDGDCQ